MYVRKADVRVSEGLLDGRELGVTEMASGCDGERDKVSLGSLRTAIGGQALGKELC